MGPLMLVIDPLRPVPLYLRHATNIVKGQVVVATTVGGGGQGMGRVRMLVVVVVMVGVCSCGCGRGCF